MSALIDRDTNVQSAMQNESGKQHQGTGEENKPQEAAQYRPTLEQRLAKNSADNQGQAYVSPSDAILSPASQKLANMKQRQMNKQANRNPAARTLFSRTVSSCSTTFDDTDAVEEKS